MLSRRVGASAPRLNARAPPQHYDLHRIMSEFLGLGLYNRHRQAVQRNRFFTEPRQFCALNPLWSEAPQRTLYIFEHITRTHGAYFASLIGRLSGSESGSGWQSRS